MGRALVVPASERRDTATDRTQWSRCKKEEGGSYDRFRGRLMFPVFDLQDGPSRSAAHAEKQDAKYINSPETAAYVKGRNLFGLNLTRDEIRRQGFAILVEGFLDLIVPYQYGVRNIAASLGTALTTDQVKLLSRFARKVVVNYDGDRAGVQAAKKSIEILLAEDLEVKVLVLPDNADPDEYIRKFGVTEYQRRRAQAQPHIQFVIENALRDATFTGRLKAEAVEEVLPYIRAVNSRIQKREYFDMAMDGLRITDPALRRELWQSVRDKTVHRTPSMARLTQHRQATAAEQRLLGLLFADEKKPETQGLADVTRGRLRGSLNRTALQSLNRARPRGFGNDFDTVSAKTDGDDVIQTMIPMVLLNSSLRIKRTLCAGGMRFHF